MRTSDLQSEWWMSKRSSSTGNIVLSLMKFMFYYLGMYVLSSILNE